MMSDSGKSEELFEPDSKPFLQPDSHVDRRSRHLPHWQLDGGFYYVTWRLADALPQSKLQAWMDEKRQWLKEHPPPWTRETYVDYKQRFPTRIDAWLDAGYGSCVLRTPGCRRLVSDALLYFDNDRYDMAAFVVMPNHVHALAQLRGTARIETVTHSWKRYSARQINKRLNRHGSLWQQENWDRILRGVPDLVRCLSYIRRNPELAGLAGNEYTYYESPSLPDAIAET